MFSTLPETSDLAAHDETTLISLLLEDDESAWRLFHQRYGHRVQGAIFTVTRRFPQLGGSDAVDEIYGTLCLRLLCDDKRRLRSFDPKRGTRLGSWLCTLARNSAHDFVRSRRRDPWLGRAGDETAMTEVESDAPDAFAICASREQARRVSAELATMSDRDQEFMELYLEGLAPTQIAEKLGVALNTVYSKRHKIQLRLADLQN
jgi:RNA polymerase sigma-70 factor (ECF subfamily)